jgi:RNA polymerase sigma-70 factor, ECF subfamily
MELFTFDSGYVERLRSGHPETQQHFVTYFSELLLIKLRARFLPPDVIEDVRQETFARVLRAIRQESTIQQPERLGAFVNSVCNNVLLEQHRARNRYDQMGDEVPEVRDTSIDLEGQLISDEAQANVRKVLTKLSAKDREVIRIVLLEEGDKDQLCRKLGVERDYLRVLLHRAKQNFKASFEKTVIGSRIARESVKR